MKKNQQYQQWLNPELISLVAYTVEAMAKSQGYSTYPKEEEVKQVLQGLCIIDAAIKAKEGKDVG